MMPGPLPPLPLPPLTGLRGLTSVIGWRMEAHYTISAPCLSIRVTERGLVAVLSYSELSTSRLTKPGPLVFRQREGPMGRAENKISPDLIKALHLQSLDTGGTSVLPARPDRGPVAPAEFFNFSHPPTSAPRGFHLPAGRKNCPTEGETSALRPCLGISRCKCATNKFPAQHNAGLPRQGDEMRKEDGLAEQKSTPRRARPPARQLVSKRIPRT